MKRWKKILLALAAFVLVVAAVMFTLMRMTAPVPASCAWTMDLSEVRTAAAAIAGDKPGEIRAEHIASFEVPEAVVVIGAPFEKTQMVVYAYQLVFPDKAVVVDTAMDEAAGKAMHTATYDGAAWGRIVRGLSAASAIYVTHEHADHLGGAVSLLSDPQVVQHVPRVALRARGTPR